MKHKFYKNVFQTITCFFSIIIIDIPLIIGFFESLCYESNYGWLLLIFSIFLIILFFIIGFYWIFQKVIFDEKGIKIVFFNKNIKNIEWNQISIIEVTSIMKIPAIKIKTFDNREIHLDKRKKIIKLIELYSNKKILNNNFIN